MIAAKAGCGIILTGATVGDKEGNAWGQQPHTDLHPMRVDIDPSRFCKHPARTLIGERKDPAGSEIREIETDLIARGLSWDRHEAGGKRFTVPQANCAQVEQDPGERVQRRIARQRDRVQSSSAKCGEEQEVGQIECAFGRALSQDLVFEDRQEYPAKTHTREVGTIEAVGEEGRRSCRPVCADIRYAQGSMAVPRERAFSG